MNQISKNLVRLVVLVLTLASFVTLLAPARAQAGAPPEINHQLGKSSYDKYVNGTKGAQPWLSTKTVGVKCETKLTETNAYSRCNLECSPGHGKGSLANVCQNACLARFCENGK